MSVAPVFWTILSSVWSRAMRPRLRPEKRPDMERRRMRKTTISQTGKSSSYTSI